MLDLVLEFDEMMVREVILVPKVDGGHHYQR